MALTQEQRALLQLLLERDQTYDDISGLLGMDVGQVRRRARLALIEIGGSDPDEQVALTDYLLGQADPIGRADVARHLRSDPAANALARKLTAQLRLLAPDADIPEIPAADGRAAPAKQPPPRPAAAQPKAEKPASPGGSSSPAALTSKQRTLIASILGAGVLILVIVLLATGAVGGDDDDSGGSNGGDDPQAEAPRGEAALTRAVLLPPGGGESPNGVAIFGRLRNTPVIQVTASGLDAPPEGSNYSVWLFGRPEAGPVALRLTQVDRVDESGRILIRFPIPAQALGFVANQTFDEIILSLTEEAAYQAEIRAARTDDPPRLPAFTGDPVLRGAIVGPGTESAETQGAEEGG